MITTIRLSKQLYLLRDREGCFANLVIGKRRALLFDTACGIDDLRKAVEAITGLPLLVIASHGHFDHIGGSYQFEKVYLSEKDWCMLSDQDKKRFKKLDFHQFDLGNLSGEIVELPGHSKGSVGVYIPEWKVLLSGDALTPIMCLIFQNHGTKEEQLETLRYAEQLNVDYYLTGHSEKKMTGDLIHRMIRCIERSEGKRYYAYEYPKPPYSKGWFYLDSIENEPVGLIVEDKPEKV